MAIEREQFFKLMGSFASGVTVVTCRLADGTPRGFTASAFCSLSLNPPLCLICVDNRSESLPGMRDRGSWVINILAAGQEELSQRFASKVADKFEGVAYRDGDETGCPILDGALVHIECKAHALVDGGDHTIAIGEIVDGVAHDGAPLVYFRAGYRALAS